MRSIPRILLCTALAAFFLAFGVAAGQPSLAQSHALLPESEVWVDGTSNKSDWTVYATEIDATVSFDDEAGVPTTLQITMPSKEVKSNESTIMDRLMHKALKVSEHPTITYELVDAVPSGDGSVLTTGGNLTLAGVTKEIEMDVAVEETDNGRRYTGTVPLKMSDFDMKPPVAMFGALRTADDVTVGFDVVFAPAD